MIQTYPLHQMSLDEAIDAQFRLVDAMHRHFNGREALEAGDMGIPRELGRPRFTAKVEAVLAEFFEAEDAVLVPGAGTGGIRSAMFALLRPQSVVLFHDAPLYPTTAVTCRAMGLQKRQVDYNDTAAVEAALAQEPAMVYIQHTRQRFEDRYDPAEIVALARQISPRSTVLVDDNYAAMQMPKIGVQLGADLSTFSMFKLLGDAGVACVLGRADIIQRIREDNYSGGTKIQGPSAVDSLKHLVYTPVTLAVHARSVAEIVARLNRGEVPGVRRAFVGNHAERVALVEMEEPIASKVTEVAWQFGAAPYPIGSMSRFEVNVMIYRVSRVMTEGNPELVERMFRVQPYRSGPDTVIRVLGEAVRAAQRETEKVAV